MNWDGEGLGRKDSCSRFYSYFFQRIVVRPLLIDIFGARGWGQSYLSRRKILSEMLLCNRYIS